MEILTSLFTLLILIYFIKRNKKMIIETLNYQENDLEMFILEENLLKLKKKMNAFQDKSVFLNKQLLDYENLIEHVKIKFKKLKEDYIKTRDLEDKNRLLEFKNYAQKISISNFIEKSKEKILLNNDIKEGFELKMNKFSDKIVS